MAFTGRQHEIDVLFSELNAVKESGEGRFVWLRGRRRVGKSRLVQEFCNRANAPYAFYQAPRREHAEALSAFTKAIAVSSLPVADAFDGVSHPSWPSAIRAAIREIDPAQPAILVIDELPYLAEFDPGFTADLQMAWDRMLERAPVLLICIGSDVRMMEVMVEARSPLFGRPTREMRVAPLNPAEVAEINSPPDAAAAIDRYLLLGGFPLLAPMWPASAGLTTFLRKALGDDQTPFVTTALRILASEFERPLQAERVLEAIGHGETAYNRIETRSGVKGNTLTDALDMLIEKKGLVAKGLPYAVPPGRKAARYTVADPYLRFWLRFVGPHLDELSRGMSDLVVARIERDWAAYRGRAVEPLVRSALERLIIDPAIGGQVGGSRHVGAWWRRDHSIEVDLVGGDRVKPTRIGFVGSVKWRERGRFSTADLEDLEASRAHVPGAEGAKLVAVSRSGFQDGLAVDASFGPDELLAAW